MSGTKIGFTLPGPFSTSFVYSRSSACKLPTPEPIAVPTRYGSSFAISSPASSKASLAAATAYWEKSSIRFAALKSIYSFPTKPFTSAARCALYSLASNFVISANPSLLSLMPFQNSSTFNPIGVIAPNPVTTTLLISTTLSFLKSPCRRQRTIPDL